MFVGQTELFVRLALKNVGAAPAGDLHRTIGAGHVAFAGEDEDIVTENLHLTLSHGHLIELHRLEIFVDLEPSVAVGNHRHGVGFEADGVGRVHGVESLRPHLVPIGHRGGGDPDGCRQSHLRHHLRRTQPHPARQEYAADHI